MSFFTDFSFQFTDFFKKYSGKLLEIYDKADEPRNIKILNKTKKKVYFIIYYHKIHTKDKKLDLIKTCTEIHNRPHVTPLAVEGNVNEWKDAVSNYNCTR